MKTITCILILVGLWQISFCQTGEPVLNEFMAKNTLLPVDNAGEAEDWIEIFNPWPDTLDLGGYYFTDDASNPVMWQVPVGNDSTRVPPGGFLIFWADEDLGQGVMHLNFKLSVGGEFIGLVSPAQEWIDSLSFGVQTGNVSLGRVPDGVGSWQLLSVPSPGLSNSTPYLWGGPGTLVFSSNGNGTHELVVTSNTVWSVSCPQSWVSFSPAGGSGNGLVVVTPDANSQSGPRSAVVQISAQGLPAVDIQINQLGTTPTLVVSATQVDLEAPLGSQGGFQVLSNLTWSVTSPVTWLDINPAVGADVAGVVLTANEGNPGLVSRSAVVTVSATGVPDRLITVQQAGHPFIPLLVINEVLSGASPIVDNHGEPEDFLEIFNPGPDTLELGGLYLTDDPDDPLKWHIPVGNDSTRVPPGGWIVFWADEDSGQGVLHTNFKFSALGEFAGVYVDSHYLADTLSFGADTLEGISRGRIPDGSGPIVACTPTPGAANAVFVPQGMGETEFSGTIFPNPAGSRISFPGPFEGPIRYEIHDGYGRLCLKGKIDYSSVSVQIDQLGKGFYYAKWSTSRGEWVQKFVKL